jgi:hypothetical protein
MTSMAIEVNSLVWFTSQRICSIGLVIRHSSSGIINQESKMSICRLLHLQIDIFIIH